MKAHARPHMLACKDEQSNAAIMQLHCDACCGLRCTCIMSQAAAVLILGAKAHAPTTISTRPMGGRVILSYERQTPGVPFQLG